MRCLCLTQRLKQDELRPLTCKGRDNYGGVQTTLVDSLDTLFLCGLKEEFLESVEHVIRTLSFDKDEVVSTFGWCHLECVASRCAIQIYLQSAETNIRLVGGLLSAHVGVSFDGVMYSIDNFASAYLHG